MSNLPATPIKADDAGSPRVPMPTSTKSQHASAYEPSPASTYGETVAGDSSPATPQDQAHTAKLIASMRAVQLEDGAGKDQVSPVMEQEVGVSYTESFGAGTSYTPHEVVTTPARHHMRDPISSSPKGTRLHEIRSSPTWRNGSGFIKKPLDAEDDPFVVATAPDQSSAAHNHQFKPRLDRVNQRIGPDNAQALLPPNACIFVANLQQAMTDEQLEFSVREVFQVFGNCYVKIRRDHKGMPFAFCQYETSEDAQRAIHLGRGMKVNNRECRTEVARVNRSLYLSKIAGGSISEDEARRLLAGYGDLERLWYCSQTDKEMFRLAEGIWVMFAYFQDCRDAQTAFRDHPTFRLEQPKMPDDIRATLTGRGFSSPFNGRARSFLQSSPSYGSPQYGVHPSIGNRSVFVGNLPASATTETVKERLSAYGEVELVEVVEKPSAHVSGVNTFAFVEFRTSEAAALAISSGTIMNGYRLRIEQKIDSFRRDQVITGSPIRQPRFDQQEAMTKLFQHGVSVGLATAASQAQAIQPPLYGAYSYYQPPQYESFADQQCHQATVEHDAPMALQANSVTYADQETGQHRTVQTSPPNGYPQYAPYPLSTTYEWIDPNQYGGDHDGLRAQIYFAEY